MRRATVASHAEISTAPGRHDCSTHSAGWARSFYVKYVNIPSMYNLQLLCVWLPEACLFTN